jgi:hypothetical protein
VHTGRGTSVGASFQPHPIIIIIIVVVVVVFVIITIITINQSPPHSTLLEGLDPHEAEDYSLGILRIDSKN